MAAFHTITAQAQVLLVEDDAATREMLATALRVSGYQVRTAADGLAGLRLLDSCEPAVVVLDLALPIASGLEVMRELRVAGRKRDVPVIGISGHDDILKLAAATSDFFATLAKPFEPAVLVRTVERALRQQQVQAGLGAVEPPED